MNRYPFHIGDYRKATDHLTDTEDLTYRRLIDFYYDTEMPIPTDLVSVSRRIRCSRGDVEQILNEFFHLTDKGWRHYRCDKELEAIYVRSAAAKASIESRWNRQKHMNVLPTNNDSNTNGILPITHNPLPITKTKSKADALATRLPADWQPSTNDILFCKTTRPDLDHASVAAAFKDYWIAVAGAKGKKLDWPATWRNWVRNQRGINGSQQKASEGKKMYEILTGRKPNEPPTTRERDISGDVVVEVPAGQARVAGGMD